MWKRGAIDANSAAESSSSIRQRVERTSTEKQENSGNAQVASSNTAVGSAVNSEDETKVPDRRISGGPGMRLPGPTGNRRQSNSQIGQTSTEVATTSGPDVVQFIGPISQDEDLRRLPYIPPTEREEGELRLTRYRETTNHGVTDPLLPIKPALPASMPSPIQSFSGVSANTSASGLIPPDTNGDVGPNHYIQSVNSSIQVFSKTGSSLSGPTTFNSFFSSLGSATPCGNNQNDGDGVVFYDHLANRWVVTDFAFASFPGNSFYECIGVSKTGDPVAGGWWLYALQIDSANPTYLGDYPKFGLWPDAYYLSVNLFSNTTTFNGVRVYALNRSSMINGTGAPNPGAIAFTISPATLGDAHSLLPATFRTGSSPPAGTAEYFLSITSPFQGGVSQNQVLAWRFHVDFNTPANSTFGVSGSHGANGVITVNPFVDAYTSTSNIIPQPPGAPFLDSLGDRLMYPLVYQNLSGSESLWASHTVNNNENGTGPTAIRWYQFNVTGSTIPAAPMQQNTFNNNADGFWRWMPSIAVDSQGNMSIGYSVAEFSIEPSIRYAGRLAVDPPNQLSQGEAQLIAGGGHQTSGFARWGDYSALSIDPSDNCTFWHTNEYYSTTSASSWETRIGSFKFPSCGVSCAGITGTVSGGGTTCPGNSINVTVNVTGGSPPYTVKLTNNAETQAGAANQAQFIFTVSPVVNTTYQVDVATSHDGNNCPLSNSGSATVTVTTGPATPAILTNGPQTVTVTGSSGTFTLTFNGQTTSSLAFNATASQVQTALNALSSIAGTGGSAAVRQQANVYAVTFGGALTGPVALMTGAGSGGASVAVGRSVCAGSTGNQASGPAGATTYAWTITGGTITSPMTAQSITYTAPGSGSVTLGLTVTNAAGCSAANSAGMPISASPASFVALNGPQNVTVSGSAGTFTLTFKGQTTASIPVNSTASFVQTKLSMLTNIGVGAVSVTKLSNVYTVTFTGSLAGPQPLLIGAGADGASVTVNLYVCAGSAGNQATAPVSAEYAWSISNGTITSATNVQTITYTAGGSGSVTLNLTQTNTTACSTSSSAPATIKPIALNLSSQSFPGNGGTGSVSVTPSDPACSWTASTPAIFIHITSGGSGMGTGMVQYSVDVNPDANIRSGVITIGGQLFTVYQGINFADVPASDVFYTDIGKLSARGVTVGCGGGNYCPNSPVTREQMAAFILRAKGEFSPPLPPGQRFNDVPPTNVFYSFIDRLAVLQITLGCTPDHLSYCPADPVLREQMAAFILRGLGEFSPPTPPSQRFNDVLPSNTFYDFIDRLAVLQITLGCSDSPPLYCPTDPVTRAQMAAFLVRAFGL
jgi:hypothetical protein